MTRSNTRGCRVKESDRLVQRPAKRSVKVHSGTVDHADVMVEARGMRPTKPVTVAECDIPKPEPVVEEKHLDWLKARLEQNPLFTVTVAKRAIGTGIRRA